MDIDVLDSLEDLGYSGPLVDKGALRHAVELGAKSPEFTELVSWLSKELQVLCNLEGFINAISDSEESSSFLLEVSSFLKDLNCPYDCLMDGPISQRLVEKKNRILFLDFLCSELQAARLIQAKSLGRKKSLDIKLGASTTATSLGSIMSTLDAKMEDSGCPEDIFTQINSKVKDMVDSTPELIPEPVLKDGLSEQQWEALEKLQCDMHSEYSIRREMLLTRLDVTVQSFKWGENSKGKQDEIAKTYKPRRVELKANPSVNIDDVLAAREEITVLEKTSSAALVKNTKSSVNRVLIGDVPDRGGRPKEQRPPVEMPGWQRRSQGRGDGGFRGGHGKKFHQRGKGGGGGGGGQNKGSKKQQSQQAFDAAGKY